MELSKDIVATIAFALMLLFKRILWIATVPHPFLSQCY